MANPLTVHRLDYINIGLLLFSCILAFVIPFELFLFAYGVLGPLHYLTEISWLHDKNYYSTDKRDVLLLVVVSLILTVVNLKVYIPLMKNVEFGEPDTLHNLTIQAIFVAFASSIFFAFIKNKLLKWVGVFLTILASALSLKFELFFSVFLPTLIHVFIFTWLFMLYGSLKNRSVPGYLSVVIAAIIPFILFYFLTDKQIFPVSGYGKTSYEGFEGLNKIILLHIGNPTSNEELARMVYHSPIGIGVMRIIAFAYTYHYLNWFSKTKVIGWHDIPKSRAIFIIIIWAISVGLYAVNYSLGFKWLFLLSFMHVMLEFPLNYISFVGIFRELKSIAFKPAA